MKEMVQNKVCVAEAQTPSPKRHSFAVCVCVRARQGALPSHVPHALCVPCSHVRAISEATVLSSEMKGSLINN